MLCKFNEGDHKNFYLNNIKKGKGIVCSKECARVSVSELFTGRKLPRYIARKIGDAHKGMKRSEETRRKIGDSHRGEKCYMWNSDREAVAKIAGVRRTTEYRNWRKKVIGRDGYICRLCGKEEKEKIHVDHIRPVALFLESIYDESNGRVLCVDCHKKTPTYGGQMRRIGMNNNIITTI